MTFSVLTSSPCQYNEVYFDLLLLTDGAGDEVSWSLMATSTNNIVLSGSDYSSYTQVNVVECIPSDCYTFVINDSGGNGLCCELGLGGFSVRLNGRKLASGTEFGYQEEFDLQCLLTPTVSPTSKVSFARALLFPQEINITESHSFVRSWGDCIQANVITLGKSNVIS